MPQPFSRSFVMRVFSVSVLLGTLTFYTTFMSYSICKLSLWSNLLLKSKSGVKNRREEQGRAVDGYS